MKRRTVLSVTAGLVALTGCLDEGEPTDGPATDDDEDRARILDTELVRRNEATEEESVTIEGQIRILQEGLEHVEVEGRFFDEEEELLDMTTERLQEVDPGIQEFEIQFPRFGEDARAVDGYQVAIGTIIEI